MNRRTGWAIALAVAATGLAGCSSLAEPANSTSPTTAAAMPSWPRVSCSVASPNVVGAALNIPVDAPTEVHNDPVTVCTYVQKSKANAVVVRFQTAVDASIFASSKSGVIGGSKPPQDIPNFADGAYSSSVTSQGVTTNTLAAWKGTIAITVTSTASVDQEKALVQQLFGVVGAGGASASASG